MSILFYPAGPKWFLDDDDTRRQITLHFRQCCRVSWTFYGELVKKINKK